MRHFAYGVALPLAIALSGCSDETVLASSGQEAADFGPSHTLDASAGYLAVPSRWKEKPHDVEGPSKLLRYYTVANDYKTSLTFLCDDGALGAMVTLDTDEGNSFSHTLDTSVRFGEGPLEKMQFTYRANDIGMRPDDGSSGAARVFLDRVAEVEEVTIEIDNQSLIPVSEPEMSYNTKGVAAIRYNLDLACSGQSAS